jgi:hypothetical protein
MGRIWTSGNLLPAQNRDHYSTVSAPLPVAGSARITTWPVAELAQRVLPAVGVRYRSAREQAVLDEVARRFAAVTRSAAP